MYEIAIAREVIRWFLPEFYSSYPVEVSGKTVKVTATAAAGFPPLRSIWQELRIKFDSNNRSVDDFLARRNMETARL